MIDQKMYLRIWRLKLKPTEFDLLNYLIEMMDYYKICRWTASCEKLSKEINRSTKSIKYAIKSLREKNIITTKIDERTRKNCFQINKFWE